LVKQLSALTVLFVLLLAAPAVASQRDAIAGTPYVKAGPSNRGTVVRFVGQRGRRLFKRVAGRSLRVSCEQAGGDPLSPFSSSSGESLVAPRRGNRLVLGITSSEADWCEVLVTRKHHDDLPVVAVALTPGGAAFLENRWWAIGVDGLLSAARSDRATGGYEPTEQIVGRTNGQVIGLANPADPVPPGRFGYFSDGAQHAEAVVVTPEGKRLFEEVNADTVSTNVLPYIDSLNFG
jgi:hypothetical protein